MKKNFSTIFILVSVLHIFGQNTMSLEERKSIMDELRKEILDSLRNNTITSITSTSDSIKEVKDKPWKGKIELSAYIETYYLFENKSGNFTKLNPTVGFSFAYAFAHQFK